MIFDTNTIVYFLEIVVGGLLVGIGVHFVPVGGAPAAIGPGYRYRHWYCAAGRRLRPDWTSVRRPHDVSHR